MPLDVTLCIFSHALGKKNILKKITTKKITPHKYSTYLYITLEVIMDFYLHSTDIQLAALT